ncbi:unnamed protein product [Rotaria sp. Silwood2]|nr:unnamed protein product [Rotaria sp. Silwood2]
MNIENIYKQSNPLPFWRDHQKKFPGLSLLARRLFSIPVTSAEVERQFSSAGFTVTQRRSSLDSATLNDVLFVQSIQKVLDSKPNFFSLKMSIFLTCGDEDNACYVFSANTNKTSGAYGAMFKGNY